MNQGAFKMMKRTKRRSGKIVRRTSEFVRILNLPRRTAFKDYSDLMTELLKLPEGTQRLRVNQAWPLFEAGEMGGVVGILPVGEGKTLITFLLGQIWRQYGPGVICMPAKAVNETRNKKLPQMREHWRFPEPVVIIGDKGDDRRGAIYVISYERLARDNYADFFDRKRPGWIACDEAHKLRRKNSVRRRIDRYLKEFPDTKYGAVSGTLVEESIKDYGHILEFALDENSPLPRTWTDLDDWAGALDDNVEEDERVEVGALEMLCEDGEDVRSAYSRRLLETQGVCAALNPEAVGSSLIIRETFPKVPKTIERALMRMRKLWETPGGEVITTGLEFNRHAHELALGFYYRWVWPNDEVDYEWLDARREWRSFVRHIVRYSMSSPQPYDTEKQVREACSQGIVNCPNEEYEKWFSIAGRSDPKVECVWVDDFMVENGLRWLKQADKNRGKDKALAGVLWVNHNALLEEFERRGVPVYGGGNDGILDETKSCVASFMAHYEAKNLQHNFSQCNYFYVPASGQRWEQSLGRFHRTGQTADEVVADVPLHTIERWEAFQTARSRANYQQQTTQVPQKLCYAQVDVRDETDIHALIKSTSGLWTKKVDFDDEYD